MKVALESLVNQMHRGGIFYAEAVREFRKVFVATVLRENGGNQCKAARQLGMHRNTLTRTASMLGLDIRVLRFTSRRSPQGTGAVTAAKRISG